MALPTKNALYILLPLVVIAALVATGLKIPVPVLGRDYVVRYVLPETGETALPEIAGGSGEDLPLIVIDPGHGGHDPGASSDQYQEKSIVLGLARALRDRLVEEGIARVALTRDDDRYLLHEERFGIARRLGADLFLSIHADSAGEKADIAGASIYTLSNEASSEAAALYAERENRSDWINGEQVGRQSDVVSTILVELSQRRTQEESAEFAGLIEREGRGTIRFHPQARRSASLAVLRAPDIPSVLFESGFITNRADAERLASLAGRTRFADVMARAIRIYFARNSGELSP